jgi:probable F420-dependent oxidoreductase
MTDVPALLGPIGVWGHLASLSANDLRPFVGRVADLGYGTLWVGEATARDPFSQLAAVAAVSGSMTLATSIINIFGRDAMASKMGAMTLHELTGGRFALGLGVSHVHLVQKLRGHTYERPLSTMRDYLEAYEGLPYRGPTMAGPDGQPTRPPVLLAALRTKMVQLSAVAADGALPFFISAARVAWMRDVLDDAAPADRPRPTLASALPVIVESDTDKAREGARAWVAPYCRAINYQKSLAEQGYSSADWEPPYSDRLIDDIVACGDVDEVHARITELRSAGADHVAVIPIDTDGRAEHMATLEALAPGS